MMFLQAQRPVSHQKPWHEPTLDLDVVACFEKGTIV
jgi:hypothetical protein